MSRPLIIFIVGSLLAGGVARAAPKAVEPIPGPGIALSAEVRRELAEGVAALGQRLAVLARDPAKADLVPDVAIYHKAVDWALRYDEFYSPKQVAQARAFLQDGTARAEALAAGRAPWREQSGLVLRGYRSAVDGSIQPYALVVPPGVKADSTGRHPAMVWLLGRDEKRTELAFMADAASKPPPLAPPGAILIRPYGRFCNATKFAGETDVFEALHATEAEYGIDPERIGLAGFSMGGASVWHLAAHHSDVWCFASPGAGFAETPLYTKALEPGKPPRFPWEVTLWHWYDALACAANLSNLHAIAYSGEIDPQRQSADLMEEAMAKQGLTLERLIGPKTGHKYEPATRAVLESRIEAALQAGRDPSAPRAWLVTYSLCDPDAGWLRAEGMGRQWQRAEIRAAVDASGSAAVTTTNLTDFSIRRGGISRVVIDGQDLAFGSGRFHREGAHWVNGPLSAGLRKRPGLSGPVDDAFTAPFLFVRPTGRSANTAVSAWAAAEMERAMALWRRTYRGEVPVKDDTAVTADDFANKNLILWGDPASNAVLALVAARLPVRWSAAELAVGGRTYAAASHAPLFIYPNPLAPQHYVVVNSGIDFRDEAYGTNALQTPKLPDWAVVDIAVPANGRWPGRMEDAGFFDEAWGAPRSALTP